MKQSEKRVLNIVDDNFNVLCLSISMSKNATKNIY